MSSTLLGKVGDAIAERDLLYILDNLRERDRKEMAATGDVYRLGMIIRPLWDMAKFKSLFMDRRGNPAAFIMMHEVTPVSLSASLLATDRWLDVARPLTLWGLRFFKPQALEMGYRRCECRTLAGHVDAIWFLERMGFLWEARIEDFGRNGEVFEQYAWRLTHHVSVQCPKDAKGPGPADHAEERGRGRNA
jgi:hypothetical protein